MKKKTVFCIFFHSEWKMYKEGDYICFFEFSFFFSWLIYWWKLVFWSAVNFLAEVLYINFCLQAVFFKTRGKYVEFAILINSFEREYVFVTREQPITTYVFVSTLLAVYVCVCVEVYNRADNAFLFVNYLYRVIYKKKIPLWTFFLLVILTDS